MADDPSPASPTSDTPPPHTTGGGFRWEPPTAADLQAMMPGYTIEKILGRGGMGAVYKGVQENLDRTVAIKILPPGVEKEDPSFAERFKSEARLMAKLNHPGVVAVYDFGKTSDGQLYFAMEYVDGTDVAQMIKAQRKLPADHSLAITAHMCDALGAAHELGIVHRDIKPANVLLNMKGQVKVADFGLAKVEEPGTHGLTKTGYAMGTPDFVAPEVLMLGTHIDGRADLYAVGVMLYQMLTGEVPRGAFKPASVLVPGLDRRYDPIIMKAMQSDREERYQSSAELRADLDVILTVPLVKQDAPTGAAAIPAAQVSQAPGQRSMAQKPVGKPPQPKSTTDTPVCQDAAPAAKSAHGTSQTPAKSKTPLFAGLGIAAVLAIGALVMFSGKKPDAGKPDAPASAAVPSQTALAAASATPPKASPPAATSKPQWTPVDLSKFPTLDDGKKIRRVDNGVLHVGGGGGASLNDASFRNGAIRFTCLWGGNMDASLRTQPGSKTTMRIRVNDLTFIDLKDGAKGKPAAGSPIKTLDLPKTLKAGAEPVFEFAAIGAVLYAWCDGQLLGQAPTTLLEEGGIGFQASGIGGKVKNIEYLNLDGLSEPEALKVLGLDAKGAAAPTPVAAAKTAEWKTLDLAGKLESAYSTPQGSAEFRNGVLEVTDNFFVLIANDCRDVAVRVRFAPDAEQDNTKIGLRAVRADKRLSVARTDRGHGKMLTTHGSNKDESDLTPRFPMPDSGAASTLEAFAIGDSFGTFVDGRLAAFAETKEIDHAGNAQISAKHALIESIEYLVLDGVPRAQWPAHIREAIESKGKPTAVVSSSPSLPLSSSSDKFPPGQWVKVFTKLEDLSPKARNQYKLTWKDGWIDGTTSSEGQNQFDIPNTRGRNQGFRVRLKHDPRASGTYPGGLVLRTGTGHRYGLNYNFADHSARIMLVMEGKKPQTITTLTPKQDQADGSEYELEFYAIGERLIGRMNGELLPIGIDASIGEGNIAFSVKHLIRDIEVINLDGLSEAEALKLAGVDEQGKVLRTPAAPTAADPSSPSLPVPASSDKFPPGQWVKLFTKADDLPEELRQPDSGVKFEDGWFRFDKEKNSL